MKAAMSGLAFLLSLAIASLIWRSMYRLFLHPLSKFPGPKLAAMSNLPYVNWIITGQLHSRIRQLHDRHGDVVRIRPNALTYRNPQAWPDIYGHRKQGTPSFRKDPEFYLPSASGASHIVNANNEDHARFKRLLTHAFSERSLREQEAIIMTYIDLFIDRLRSAAFAQESVDMAHWLNFLTFDIIGDLAFGESFGCLKDSRYHPWVATIFQSIKIGAFLRALSIYPLLALMVRNIMPKSFIHKRVQHYQFSKERVGQRLQTSIPRPDFISYILKYNDERGMSRSEIETNAAILIQAGSETTATALAACCFYLQKNQTAYANLAREIREAFPTDKEITFQAVSKLQYLNAVIEESMRLYPPLPAIQPRLVPSGGAWISGQYVPAGVSVSVAHYSAFRGSANFAEPDTFYPERWLNEGHDHFAHDRKEASQPFSYGPRSCIGRNLAYAEMRTILAKILWHFDLSIEAQSTDWDNAKSYIVWENRPLWYTTLRPS
ncbi:cytochrome P450 [Aspergillus alliaceus]|uniref:Cytochrome P450 n=1 Tax=Petromyces alliaceus TaxID=209559 RepID=A0A5N7C6Y9_PETAA|nr:cytochrome P450 [Aspergillus alliaceus]